MSVEAELMEKRDILIEKVGSFLENEVKMAPVASRMLAYITLSCREGVTFEEMVFKFGVSKSTVSSNLNMLEESGRIESFTKEGDRKRYYRPISNEFIRFIDEKIRRHQLEKEIQQEVLAYKKETNAFWKDYPEKQCRIQFHENILTFLKESISSFKKLKVTLIEK